MNNKETTNFWTRLFRAVGRTEEKSSDLEKINIPLDSLGPSAGVLHTPPVVDTNFNGDSFWNGFGAVEIQQIDYWTLRARSASLFNDNLMGRGLIRRLVTNEINTGLGLESIPEARILGITDDEAEAWSEDTESRFKIWSDTQKLCDHKGMHTFGELQQIVRQESLIDGDILVIKRMNKSANTPTVQLVDANSIRSPLTDPRLRKGHEIEEGVETDASGQQVAYWILQKDGSSKRLSAFGRSTGERIAWLVYGTDKRMNAVRGTPLLGLIMQSCKEAQRYMDSVQRKAVINSNLAMFIKKTQDKIGSKPISASGTLKGSTQTTSNQGVTSTSHYASNNPGVVIETLQQGEEPVAFNTSGVELNYQEMLDAIVAGMAWANEIPPSILKLSFSANYSASQAELNEFKIYLNKVRTLFSNAFLKPFYSSWLVNEAIQNRIEARGLIEASQNERLFNTFGAWVQSDWSGAIKPSTDNTKLTKAYSGQIAEGLITRERASKELNGMKFSRNVKKLAKENELWAEAQRPILELRQEFGAELVDGLTSAVHAIKEEEDSDVVN